MDVDDVHRARVLETLATLDVSPRWSEMVREVIEMEADEQSRMLGDELPIGLRLVAGSEK